MLIPFATPAMFRTMDIGRVYDGPPAAIVSACGSTYDGAKKVREDLFTMQEFPDQVKTPPAQHDLTGKTVGRFAIEARLGAGGMGEVYRAVDSTLKRTVAIKRMSWRAGLTPEDHSRFLREGQRASALQHPNIASIYDVFEENGEVLLVMEYVEGSTLRHNIGKPMPPEQFFDIAIQCANALAAAHEKGILHGDIKPENIMLGTAGQVKLLDFGVARQLPSEDPDGKTETVNTLWAPGHLSGTPSYMSPEVLKGARPDARADIFALGIVFYEMLSGRHPFRGANVTVTTAHILDEREAATLDRSALKVASPVAAVVARALLKDPSQRYRSARDLRKDLETVRQGGRPVQALKRPVPKWQLFLIPVLSLVVAAAMLPAVRSRVAGWWKPHAPAPAAKPVVPRLAVLPPRIDGTNPELTAFADGLSATVAAKLSSLSQNHDLEVIDTAQVIKEQASSPTTALNSLGANLTLELAVQQAGDMNRTTYKLANAKTGREVGEETFTAPRSDPFSLQDRVADGVVKALQIDLRPEERTALAVHGTTEPAAYDYFLQARGYLQTTSRPENITNAIGVLDRALALDPNFGKAYAARGEAYWRSYQATKQNKWVDQSGKDCNHAVSLGNAGADGHLCLGLVAAGTGDYQQAANEYRNAVELDPASNDGYVGLANSYARLNKLSDAEHTYQQAISLNPNSQLAFQQLGNFYVQQAEYAKAIVAFQQAIHLAPESYMDYSNLGAVNLFLGNPAGAISALEQSLRLRPTPGAYANVGTAYYQSRRFAQAATSYRQALKFSDHDPDLWGNLADALYYDGQRAPAMEAYRKQLGLLNEQLQVNPRDAERQGDAASCYAMLGDKENAIAHLSRSLELGHGDKDLLFNAAVVYNDLGETGVALEWMQKALAAGYSASIVKDSPSFDNLRTNPQFQQLLSRALVK
jgi:serine/threonine-protein kinase